jgi:hypothetical protein
MTFDDGPVRFLLPVSGSPASEKPLAPNEQSNRALNVDATRRR